MSAKATGFTNCGRWFLNSHDSSHYLYQPRLMIINLVARICWYQLVTSVWNLGAELRGRNMLSFIHFDRDRTHLRNLLQQHTHFPWPDFPRWSQVAPYWCQVSRIPQVIQSTLFVASWRGLCLTYSWHCYKASCESRSYICHACCCLLVDCLRCFPNPSPTPVCGRTWYLCFPKQPHINHEPFMDPPPKSNQHLHNH